MLNDLKTRLSELRNWMQLRQIDAVILTCRDPHQSESVAEHWKTVQWFTGFTGSVGRAVVTLKHAAFWTDGRYEEQARRQISADEISLYSISDPEAPKWIEWLKSRIPEDGRIALDGSVLSLSEYRTLLTAFSDAGISYNFDLNEFLEISWKDRPKIPSEPLYRLADQYVGQSAAEKLARVRREVSRLGLTSYSLLVCGLDDIVWITNLRGHDNPLYPFFHAFVVIQKDRSWLFTDVSKLSKDQKEELEENGIQVYPYDETAKKIKSDLDTSCLLIDPAQTPLSLMNAVSSRVKIVELSSVVCGLKACKTAEEIQNIRRANTLEAAAVVRLMRWIEQNIGKIPLNEFEVGQKLNEFRALSGEYLQPANIPIVGARENAAVIHYRPSAQLNSAVTPEGFLLFDVCAQYCCGTTDLTRTVAVGELSAAMKIDYTLVLKAHIRLASQKFPLGTTGNLLDAIAKADLWNQGKNFRHGTGHGIGYISNVHEGPGKISVEFSSAFPYAQRTELKPGMVFSDEPGIYRVGKYGIRIENAVVVKEAEPTEFGKFL